MSHTVSRIISDETLSRIIQIESAGDPHARARTSSATGLGQFIESTWIQVVGQHRPDLLNGRTRAEVLRLRTDPAISIEMLARFAEDNAALLSKLHSEGDLYLAHFAGPGTARRLLNAEADAPVSAIMSAAAINANPTVLRGKTCAEVRAWAARKMSAAGGRDWVGKWYRGPELYPGKGPVARNEFDTDQNGASTGIENLDPRSFVDWRVRIVVVVLAIAALIAAHLSTP